MSGVSANRIELLQIADAVAREKLIDRDLVIEAMQDAIERAARSRYGVDTDIRSEINKSSGELRMWRVRTVVEEVVNPAAELTLKEALSIDDEAEIGKEYLDTLPPLEFGRVAAINAKQVIIQRVREAERDRQYEEYKERIGEIVNGVIKRVEYGNVIVDLGRAEAIIRRDQTIPREMFKLGERVRAYVLDVRREAKGPQIFLSRTHNQFMVKLFTQEVPEIYDGVIQIKGVARDPGSRAKITVYTPDSSIDPVGACVGMRGSRVQAVVGELQGEKVDIIPWSEDSANLVINALAPANVAKVVLDEDAGRIEVVVGDDQLSLAIGRRGQNVRLASQLTGWDIDILTEAEESEKRQVEFVDRTETFMAALNVDELIAQLLATEGFTSLEEIAYVELEEIEVIEGFDEATAQEIQNRALDYLREKEAAFNNERLEAGVQDELLEINSMTYEMLAALGRNEVLSIEDLAGCITDDLTGWNERKNGELIHEAGFFEDIEISREDCESMIYEARERMGWLTEEEIEEAEAKKAQLEAQLDEENQKTDLYESENVTAEDVFGS